MPDVLMPRLSDAMEDGVILTWLKNSGDQVEIGDEIVEIETDKSTVAYVAEHAGTLLTLVEEGATVAVGTTIARIDEVVDGSAAGALVVGASVATGEREQTIEAPEPPAARPDTELRKLPSASVVSYTAPADGSHRASPATPLARRHAAFHGVNLTDIAGTGPLGRITRADVLRHAGVTAGTRPTPDGTARKELTRLQQLVARRMVESKATIPHFQVVTEACMDEAIALRAQLKAAANAADATPSINDLIIKASAFALREHPLANGSFSDGAYHLHEHVNVGMAVAADEALVVPTIFDAAEKSLTQIAQETRRLAARVRDGQITPAELADGTFTVSNLGMFGMTSIIPVINPPQAAILGVGALRETLARVEGEIVDRTLLTLTLSCDHRILYGAEASRFLALIRDLLEHPIRLLR